MADKRVVEIAGRYEKGATLREEDIVTMYNLASIGLARIGAGLEGEVVVETARLTPMGQRFVRRDRIMRNPVSRFLYRTLNCMY